MRAAKVGGSDTKRKGEAPAAGSGYPGPLERPDGGRYLVRGEAGGVQVDGVQLLVEGEVAQGPVHHVALPEAGLDIPLQPRPEGLRPAGEGDGEDPAAL